VAAAAENILILDSQWYPLSPLNDKLYNIFYDKVIGILPQSKLVISDSNRSDLIKIVEDIVVFLTGKVLISENFSIVSYTQKYASQFSSELV